MKPRLERIDPTPAPDRMFLFAYVLWAGLILAVHLVNRLTGREFIVCSLRRFTGVPCPTCGSTRAVDAAFSGDLLAAFAYNPLVMTTLLIGVPVVIMRLVAKRRIVLGLTPRERTIAWVVGLSLIALNWWHVITYHAVLSK